MIICPGWLKQNICLKSKMPRKKSFGDNLSVTHVFRKQIFRAIELAPPFTLPLTRLWCAVGGVVVALFSHKQ
jgi:hypothetical protein